MVRVGIAPSRLSTAPNGAIEAQSEMTGARGHLLHRPRWARTAQSVRRARVTVMRADAATLVSSRNWWEHYPMHNDLVARLHDATTAFDDGDVEPFVALLHPDLDWRGVEQGHLWWKRTPN